MPFTYSAQNDRSGQICQNCGTVLSQSLYCSKCNQYHESIERDIAAQETRPVFHAIQRNGAVQPDNGLKQENNVLRMPQQGSPGLQKLQQPTYPSNASFRSGLSTTPFLGRDDQAETQKIASFIEDSATKTNAAPSYITQPTAIIPVSPSGERKKFGKSNKAYRVVIAVLLLGLIVGGIAAYAFTGLSLVEKSPLPPGSLKSSTSKERLTFADTFKENKHGWNLQSEAGKYLVTIEDGSLVLEDSNNSLLPELLPDNRSFQDFKLSVDAVLSKGDAKNGYGIYMRCTSDQDGNPATYYRFEIYGDGTYAIFKSTSGTGGKSSATVQKLVNYTQDSTIQKRGNKNHIEIEARGTNITIQVNGHALKRVSDASYRQGTIALFVSNIQDAAPGAQAKFSNLIIARIG